MTRRTSAREVEERKPLTFGSLFAGIGGFDLGFERAGMQCKWQIEIDPYCQRVLAKHWPDVRRWDDVRTFPPTKRRVGDGFGPVARYEEQVAVCEQWRVDVICGGFPCQDISYGNPSGPGIDGARSGLWFQFSRIICKLRPRVAVVENVPALLARGIDRVFANLAEGGFDAEWATLPASWFGACHRRARVFVVAYPRGERLEWMLSGPVPQFSELSEVTACGDVENVRKRPGSPEPLLYRTGDGVPGWVDRTRALGNAVVPQVAEWIGRRIIEAAQ